MPKKQKKLLPSANINPADSFKFYRLNSKFRSIENTRRSVNHRKITSNFWDKVSKYLIEKPGGVYVDKLGYFCVAMAPKKTFPKKKMSQSRHMNFHTDNRVYFPVLITSKFDRYMRVFSMDRSFTTKVKQGIYNKLIKGFKYKNLFNDIYKTFIIKYKN